jgi:hypothetical protein
MRKVIAAVISFVFVIGIVGCATLPMESNLDKPVSMTDMKETPVKDFTSASKAIWLFWGLIPVVLPEVDGIIVPEMVGHNGIQNMKITTEYDFIDFVVTALTDGVVTMRTVTIQGEVYD